MTRGCRFLPEIVFKDADGFPENLRKVLKDFAYIYTPRLHIAAIICRRGGEVTITLTHDSDAVYDACLRACARAVKTWFSWVDAIDVVDVCRRECRGATDELVRQDVETGVRLLRDLLERAGVAHETEMADVGAVIRLWP